MRHESPTTSGGTGRLGRVGRTSVMELLGKANWWLPAPLARILPKSRPSEDEPPAKPKIPVPTAG
jgi:hypothetical protein